MRNLFMLMLVVSTFSLSSAFAVEVHVAGTEGADCGDRVAQEADVISGIKGKTSNGVFIENL